MATRPDAFFTLILLLIVAGLWIPQLWSSLRMDETGTYWAAEGGWRLTISRALRFQAGVVLYPLIVWSTRALGASSEALLRAPSLLAMLLATYLLFRIGRRLFDSHTALIVTIVFAAAPPVAFAAVDAHPYAFALAALTGSTLVLIKWLDRGRRADSVLYSLLAALTVYFHYLFAPFLLVHGLYAVRRLRGSPVTKTALLGTTSLLLVFLAPMWAYLPTLLANRTTLSVPLDLSLPVLLEYLAPPVLAASIGIGFLIAKAAGHFKFQWLPSERDTLILALGWLAIPPAILYGISLLGSAAIFTGLYPSSSMGGRALVAGWLIASVQSRQGRRIVVAVLALATILSYGGPRHSEDWRGAAQRLHAEKIDGSTPILFHAPFIESRQIEWLSDPEKASYLNAPVSSYPIPGKVIAMPYWPDEEGTAYVELVVKEVLNRSDRFYVVTRFPGFGWRDWLARRLAEGGFHDRTLAVYGTVNLIVFDRATESS